MKKHRFSPYKWDCWYTKNSFFEESDAFEQLLQASPDARKHLEERKSLYTRLRQREGFADLLQKGLQQIEEKSSEKTTFLLSLTNSKVSFGSDWKWLFGKGSWGFSGAVVACALLLFILSDHPLQVNTVSPLKEKSHHLNKAIGPKARAHRVKAFQQQKTLLPKQIFETKSRPFSRYPFGNVGKSQHIEFKTLYLRRGTTRSFQAESKQELYPGDFIQFAYSAGHPYHVMIISLNDKGEVSLFVPFSDSKQSHQVEAGRGLLPDALGTLELDDYVGMERIFFVYASKAFGFNELKQVVEKSFQKAGRSLTKLKSLPGPWKWKDMVILKKSNKITPYRQNK